MRGLGLVALLILGACSGGPVGTSSPSKPSTTAQVACSLPVFWNENIPPPPEPKPHAAFVHYPQGAVSDVGIIPPAPNVAGATYDRPSRRWIPAALQAVSPDGTRYAYVSGAVHVVDVASGADRVAYGGPTNFILIGFARDALYLAQATRPRQGVFEKLFRLDLVGGSPKLVPGSDRHMYQSGWVVVSGGAAWGVDYRVQGSTYT
jgi:hypothetical protein